MFCKNGKGTVLRKGIAAFLLLVLMGSSLAFAGEGVVAAEEAAVQAEATATEAVDAAKAVEGAAEGDEADEPVEGTESVEAAAEGEEAPVEQEAVVEEVKDADVEIENEDEEEGTVLFADPVMSAPAGNISVKIYYNKKIKYESYKTHDFTVSYNGREIMAYCVEPTRNWGGERTTTAVPYNAALMRKALYYSYGNPGYSQKTASYLSGVSRKACYKGNNGVYALCHVMLSYIYDGESGKGDAFKGCSSATKKVVKNFVAAIKTWPDPPQISQIGLSAGNVSASWNEKNMEQETPLIQVMGTAGNSINLPVPDGAAVVKNGEKTESGTVALNVGETFKLTAPASVHGTYSSPAIAGSMVNFQPYIIADGKKQDQLFSVSSPSYISYTVNWADFGKLNLIKTSSDESISGENSYYSLEGAEYGLYSKEGNVSYGNLVTDAEGRASLENIPYGEYYLKELEPSRGYELDVESHDIIVSTPEQTETVLEKPGVPDIETSATEKNSGESSFTAGGTAVISDTVKYSNLEPGLEYTIKGRLMDKATGNEVPSQVSDVTFTPDKSSGSFEMEYTVDSAALAGTTVVAFEKLYYGDKVLAVHEDINNRAQSVNILKPKDKSPDMGDGSMLILAALILGIAAIFGTAAILVKN